MSEKIYWRGIKKKYANSNYGEPLGFDKSGKRGWHEQTSQKIFISDKTKA